jgi:hypothetical protein
MQPAGRRAPSVISRSTFMEDYRRIISGNVLSKPSYADCWLVGSIGELERSAEYDTPSGRVVVGTAADGEMEYNLTPSEYASTDAANRMIEEAISKVRAEFRKSGGRTDRMYIAGIARDVLEPFSGDVLLSCGGNIEAMETQMERMCDIVYRYSVGLGVFDILLLADPKLEDIYIDAPCDRNRIHVTMSRGGRRGTPMSAAAPTWSSTAGRWTTSSTCSRGRAGLPFCES